MEVLCVDEDMVISLPKESNKELRVLCWNIERGYLLDAIISQIKSKNPDILLLQEVDNGNERTLNKDCAKEIAIGLGMKYYIYGVEFNEIHSPRRTPILQGGGTHGNAIISRFPIKQPKIISLPIAHDWSSSYRQPRNGSE